MTVTTSGGEGINNHAGFILSVADLLRGGFYEEETPNEGGSTGRRVPRWLSAAYWPVHMPPGHDTGTPMKRSSSSEWPLPSSASRSGRSTTRFGSSRADIQAQTIP